MKPSDTAAPEYARTARTTPSRERERVGYDRAAVDSRVRQLSSEKAGLDASLAESERRVADLEGQLAQARQDLAEQKSPSYAGLGGRASTMLRLAEEDGMALADLASDALDTSPGLPAARALAAAASAAAPRGGRVPCPDPAPRRCPLFQDLRGKK